MLENAIDNFLCEASYIVERLFMATEKVTPVFDSVEKAFLQAAIDLKIAQVNRSINAERDSEIIRLRNGHLDQLKSLSTKIRSM